ncbi:hypothetical protein AMJ87_00695 [candidate division WOR_3 bacterium SM23_60]|uniref:Squalene cyclase C-terminal domain-containing protein n=1 Tax=candidate division WOR_3 bacterium SM23_60 TaxID=1703780 RepID=A0A0S8GL78_UNCW3|nr:MAG: hypothetical protein AMJ87_00695 [candidate division WOR_3 bacterium SM23_60]
MYTTQIDWLLSGEHFVRYRTLIDLLGREKTDREVLSAKRSIRTHRLIKDIFRRQNVKGYWGSQRDIYKWWPRKDSTFWMLGVLADFGFSKQDRNVARACEYVFSKQFGSGAFGWAPPSAPGDCFTGILTESLAKLGYVDDPRIKKAYRWLVNRQRLDGGFWCKDTGQPGGPRESEPSCAFATLCALGALAQNPQFRNSIVAEKAVGFLLECWDNRAKIKYAGHDSQIGEGWEKLKYPFTDYRILKYLDVITQFKHVVNDRRVKIMVDTLLAKQDENGRFYAESIHNAWSGFDFAQKKEPSRFITLIACRILKRCAT